jgi:calcineurin-like phosphoesterase family protein
MPLAKCAAVLHWLCVAVLAAGPAYAATAENAPAASGFPTLAPLPGTGALAPAPGATAFTFVVAGDNRPAKSGDPLPETLTRIVRAIRGMAGVEAPVFALWAGDTISGKKPHEAKMTRQYQEFLDVVKGAGVPVFAAPGNHELNLKAEPKHCPKAIDEPDPSGDLLRFWTTSMGRPYGVFRYGNSAFVTVNTDDLEAKGTKLDRCKYNGYVGPEQLAALQATLAGLAADESIAHVFVLMHRPVHASRVNPKNQLGKPSRDLLKAILEDPKYRNVSFVFAAHQHLFYFHDEDHPWQTGPFVRRDPAGKKPSYIITGGAGAPLTRKATPATGGYHHYLVVRVDGPQVTVTVVKVS